MGYALTKVLDTDAAVVDIVPRTTPKSNCDRSGATESCFRPHSHQILHGGWKVFMQLVTTQRSGSDLSSRSVSDEESGDAVMKDVTMFRRQAGGG